MLAIVKEFENVEIRVEGGVDLGFGIIDFVFPMWHYRGNSFIVQCFYMGHMSMKIKLNANIGCIQRILFWRFIVIMAIFLGVARNAL